MTAATVAITSPAAKGSSPAAARSIYAEGNRIIGRFVVTVKDLYATGGVACDFQALTGFPVPIAQVVFSPHILIANVALFRYTPSWDFVNKKLVLFDQTDHDEPDTDDVTGLVYDVILVSE